MFPRCFCRFQTGREVDVVERSPDRNLGTLLRRKVRAKELKNYVRYPRWKFYIGLTLVRSGGGGGGGTRIGEARKGPIVLKDKVGNERISDKRWVPSLPGSFLHSVESDEEATFHGSDSDRVNASRAPDHGGSEETGVEEERGPRGTSVSKGEVSETCTTREEGR